MDTPPPLFVAEISRVLMDIFESDHFVEKVVDRSGTFGLQTGTSISPFNPPLAFPTPSVDVDASLSTPPARSPTPYFLTEVCENVIDMLYSEDIDEEIGNIATLLSSTLVCRAWHVRGRRMLFYSVHLTSVNSLHKLATRLRAEEYLCSYVHEVTVIGRHLHSTTSVLPVFLAVLSGKLPNLHKLSIQYIEASNPVDGMSLSYTPLHPSCPALLSSFTAVSTLQINEVVYRSYGDFARMVHSLPNLEVFGCAFVDWETGLGPGAVTLRPFAPKLRELQVYSIEVLAAKKMISACGPELKTLKVGLPLLSHDVEEYTNGNELNLTSCSELKEVVVALNWVTIYYIRKGTLFSGLLQSFLKSWRPPKQPTSPRLIFGAFGNAYELFTRKDFVNILDVLATILEDWLQHAAQATDTMDIGPSLSQRNHNVPCWLIIDIYDGEDWKAGWWHFIKTFFSTWAKQGRLEMRYKTPPRPKYHWRPDLDSSETNANS